MQKSNLLLYKGVLCSRLGWEKGEADEDMPQDAGQLHAIVSTASCLTEPRLLADISLSTLASPPPNEAVACAFPSSHQLWMRSSRGAYTSVSIFVMLT